MKILTISLLFVFAFLSVAYAINNDPALILYCPFDEGKGDTVKDTKSGLVGKINGPQWTNKGKFNGALEFAKDADNVEFPADNLLDITDAITMEAWVLPNQVQADSGIMGRRSAPNVGGYCMQWTAGMFEMWLNIGGWQGTRGKQTIVPKPGEWHHVACIFDGTNEYQYVDGVLDIKNNIPGKFASIKEVFRIGQAQTSLASVNGIIDEVAVYKRALTADEVKQDMAKGVVSPVSPAGRLVATWGMIKGE